MNNEAMKNFIQRDFEVDILLNEDGNALFYARRPKVWHFISYVYDDDNYRSINQIHIPRYEIAEFVDSLMKNNSLRASEVFAGHSWKELLIDVLKRKGSFLEELSEDVSLLNLSREKIEKKGEVYVLPEERTYKSNYVQDKSRRLIEAISFEKDLKGLLDAEDFEVYSAFCTYVDFVKDQNFLSNERIISLVQGQLEYLAEDLPANYVSLVETIQKQLMTGFIWKRNYSIPAHEAAEILKGAMSKLSDIQLAQFCLMSGMHNDGLFLPFGTAAKIVPFEQYNDFQTSGFQPDSNEAQQLRTESAFIEFLGSSL